jgi:hypothetical protein
MEEMTFWGFRVNVVEVERGISNFADSPLVHMMAQSN